MILSDLLKKRGLKFEDLLGEEREQYLRWLEQLQEQSKPITIDDVMHHIREMKEAVERELVDTDEYVYIWCFKIVNRKHVGLKARLKNYLLLEAFLESKDRAKKALEKQIKSLIEEKQ